MIAHPDAYGQPQPRSFAREVAVDFGLERFLDASSLDRMSAGGLDFDRIEYMEWVSHGRYRIVMKGEAPDPEPVDFRIEIDWPEDGESGAQNGNILD